MHPPELLTSAQAGVILGKSARTVQRIVRAWDRGSKSIPNGWVIEAKAASKVKPGRSRAS